MKRSAVRFIEKIPLLLGCLLVSILFASCGSQEEPLTLDLKSSPTLATDTPRGDGGIRFAVAPVISPEKGFASYRLFTKYLGEHLKTPVELTLASWDTGHLAWHALPSACTSFFAETYTPLAAIRPVRVGQSCP